MALIKCTNCGHMVSNKAVECPKCGCPLEKKIYCEECGQELSTKDNVCANCGRSRTEEHLSKVTKTEIISKSEEKSGMIKYAIAIIIYVAISVIACALLKRTYPPHIETEVIVSNEVGCCILVATLLILLFARRFVDRFVLCIFVPLISFLCLDNMELLEHGAGVVVHSVCIISIIAAVYKGQSPTILPYLDSISGWGATILLYIAGVIGYLGIVFGIYGLMHHLGGVNMMLIEILLSALMIYVAKKISKKTE